MKNVMLYAPPQYWRLSRKVRDKLLNGCGPAGMLNWLVPDTVYGLSIKAACNIHDFMYMTGVTEEHRREADRVFLNNMIRIIDAHTSNNVLKRLRYRRAKTYYAFVDNYGGPWFWKDKNPSETMGMVLGLAPV